MMRDEGLFATQWLSRGRTRRLRMVRLRPLPEGCRTGGRCLRRRSARPRTPMN